jgi:hypothetical protein
MKILLLTSAYPNMVPDFLLHGMRKLLGDDAVDYPRKHPLYEGVCGQPNSDRLPNYMGDDSKIDRSDLEAKVANGFFDFVICDVRAFGEQIELMRKSVCPLALLDGDDFPKYIKPGPYVVLRSATDGTDYSIPLQYSIPQELLDWIDRHQNEPKIHSVGFLGSRGPLTPDRNLLLDDLAKMFPDSMIKTWEVGQNAPDSRDDFYRYMQSCKLLLNLPGAGVNAFRYWENAACNALNVAKRVPLLVPNDFREGIEVLKFSTIHELAYIVDQVLSDRIDWRSFSEHSRAWLRKYHTSERRAEEVVVKLKASFGMRP